MRYAENATAVRSYIRFAFCSVTKLQSIRAMALAAHEVNVAAGDTHVVGAMVVDSEKATEAAGQVRAYKLYY